MINCLQVSRGCTQAIVSQCCGLLMCYIHVLNMCLHDGSESLDSDSCNRVRGMERGNNWISSSFVLQRKMELNSTIAISKTWYFWRFQGCWYFGLQLSPKISEICIAVHFLQLIYQRMLKIWPNVFSMQHFVSRH